MSPVIQSVCREQDRLAAEWDIAVRGFSAAATALMDAAGTTSKEKYERLRRDVEQARIRVGEAKQAVHQHRLDHGC